jgi:hypothetical protein
MEKTKRRYTKKTKLKIIDEPILSEANVELISDRDFKKIYLDDKNIETNNFVNKKELLNRKFILEKDDKFDNLYPSLDDPDFNIKIALKKEFNETQYDGTIFNADEIEEQSNKLCNADFELSPNQLFVRNFLSFQTPYNSLLLYHGLGTGKTCSAISVSEEMRDYLNQLGITQRIIVVASPNVQENFKLQLFDDRKLKLIDGLWNLRACTGNKYLKEINPMNMKGLSKEKVIKQIKRIINNSYLFLGYIEFANYIQNISKVNEEDPKKKKAEVIRKLKKHFSNRLIVIDEVHNIRVTSEKQDKRITQELIKLVSYVDNLRLLFLSATPMYNSYKEIIWLLNIMNKNDNRSTIELKDVFDSDGNLLIGPDGTNIGEELIKRKATGYVSFVRGENPYTFPYRIFPSLFSTQNTFKNIPYPRIQLNGREIIQPLEHLDVYLTNCGSFQQLGYNYIINNIKETASKKPDGLPNFNNLDTFGYTILQKPLQALNMLYPTKVLREENPKFDSKILLGTEGLKRCMKWKETTNPPSRNNFEYKNNDFGKIFSPENIGEYSGKIKNIIDNIYNSNGIVLIYSQFIDGGVIPIALALESIGFTRFGNIASNLFKTSQYPAIDSKTYLPRDKMDSPDDFRPATYTLLTGEKALSPDKVYDLKNLTDEDNKNGEIIKVIIISMTGAEGLDFKNLRQVHIMEPWYNLSLVEQIIGRAVRNCSHKHLPFKERNVEIFLYGTLLNNSDEEAVDLYIYRIAEMKAVQIGRVSRILKESSVDCLLNIDQTLFTEENMNTIVKQQLSNKMVIDYPIGDKAKTVSCDYMDTCDFKCKPFKQIMENEIKLDTYNEAFILVNTEKIIQRIRNLFRQKFFYKKDRLISEINVERVYPLIQINVALTTLINDKNNYLIDTYDRLGRLINIEEYYLFQPIELNNERISVFNRRVPIDYKADMISVPINVETQTIADNVTKRLADGTMESEDVTEKIGVLNRIIDNYNSGTSNITSIKRGEEDWYLYMANLRNKNIFKDDIGIEDDMIDIFLIRHILEELSFNETFELLNYIYFKNNLDSLERKVKDYYEGKILTNKGLSGIILSRTNIKTKKNTQSLLMLGNNSWSEGKQEDYTDLAPAIKTLIISVSDYNTFVGFMGPLKNEEINIFKVKNMTDKRSKGARCDQSGKSAAVSLLNQIVGKNENNEVQYTTDYAKGKNRTEICILQEMYLRYFNEINKNNKRWFLSPEESIINNLEKIYF